MAWGEGGRTHMGRPEELRRLRASQTVSSSFRLPFQRSLDNPSFVVLPRRECPVHQLWIPHPVTLWFIQADWAGCPHCWELLWRWWFCGQGDNTDWLLPPSNTVAISRNKQATNICCGGLIIWLNEKCLCHKNQRERGHLYKGEVSICK